MKNAVNVVLIIVIMVGASQLIYRHSALSKLKARHQRFVDKYGALGVEEPKQFEVRRVETGDPKHFLWRVYYPESVTYSAKFKNRFGGGSTSIETDRSGQMLIRIRFELSDDEVEIHRMTGGRGGVGTTRDQPYAQFLAEHWQDLDIQVTDQLRFAADEKAELFSIGLTDELRKSLKGSKASSLRSLAKTMGPIYYMQFGSKDAIEAAEKKEEEEKEAAKRGGQSNVE